MVITVALEIKEYFLTKNRCYIQGATCEKIGIQVHTIGTGQGTAQAVADYWNQGAVSACVHYVVDAEKEGYVLQTLPEKIRSWADGGYGNGHLITFEICESDWIRYTSGAAYQILDEAKFKADILRGYRNAVELCIQICKRRGWNPLARLSSGLYLISSHDEGRLANLSTDHVDPSHIWGRFGLTMDGFRRDVKLGLDGGGFGENESGTGSSEGGNEGNTAGEGITEKSRYAVQAGAFRVKANGEALVEKLKAAGFDALLLTSGSTYVVQCGAFQNRENADGLVKKLKAAGFDAFVK